MKIIKWKMAMHEKYAIFKIQNKISGSVAKLIGEVRY